MKYYETIVVGAGPAGSSCAWKLKQAGKEVLVLDKSDFPRLKLCTGWITSEVLKDLHITLADYPHSALKLTTRLHIAPLPFAVMPWPTRWTDYSIRRIEFDHWLLKFSGAPFIVHQVNNIDQRDGLYILDNQFSCKYLVGAGGTGCPVRRQIFQKQRVQDTKILALEKEFHYPERDDVARFFFFSHGLWGYSWYVPKGDGYLNIGLGGFAHYFERSRWSIHQHFQSFIKDLVRRDLLDQSVGQSLKVSGYAYYLASDPAPVKQDNCFLVGDSAGVATVDFAEGIGPSIKSGLAAAAGILGRGSYTLSPQAKHSIRRGLQWMRPVSLRLLSLGRAMSPFFFYGRSGQHL